MKKVLIALVCLACVGTAQAQHKTKVKTKKATETVTAATPAVKGPAFSFKGGETFDFGELKEGPAAEHVFEFTNTGNEPLIIQNASASCGCTTPEWSKEPVLPGKKGKITVRYNTQGRPDPFTKSVFVSSNATKEGERKELFIKGTVKANADAGATNSAAH